MKRTKWLLFTMLAVLCWVITPATAAPTFTGDVETDFTGAGVLTILDPGGLGDVGLPVSAPGGTVSGWDMIDFRLAYDEGTDILYVGINTSEIAGDADGDSNPGGTSAWLATAGGTDIANLGSTECFAVAFDLDQDGTYDVIAGVSGSTDISGFSVNNYTGAPGNWAFNFGSALASNTGSVYANPSASAPDLEFTILNFSTLPGQDALLAGFKVHAFMGSLEDDGIGEDNIDYEQSPSTITTITSSADTVISGGDVDLFVNEENDGDANLYNPQVVVNDGSTDIATLTAPPVSGDTNGDGVLNPGETWHWQISSVVITSATTFTATGSGTDAAGFEVTYPDDEYEQDDVTVTTLNPSTITTITSSATMVISGDSVDLTVTEENDGDANLYDPQVVVDDGSVDIAILVAPPDSGDTNGDGVLDPGETWLWVISPVVINSTTTFTATGSALDELGNEITYPDDPEEQDDVTVTTLNPTTITTISASATIVSSGDTVDLTVTEENDGDANLYDPQVVVNDGTTDINTLTAPPDSGDTNGDGVLDPGETWQWVISSVVITSTTTFTATGSAFDELGNEITYPGDPDEQDDVTVEVTGNEGCTPGFWKNNARNWDAVCWCDTYQPTDLLGSVFDIPYADLADHTLLKALSYRGGTSVKAKARILLRHAVAALLNACSEDIDYPVSEDYIKTAVNAALASGVKSEILSLKNDLASYNELGCPTSQHCPVDED